MKKLIFFENINIKIKEKNIISNANIELEAEKFVFLKGKVGSGKTSLLRSIYADLPLSGDTANVLDFDLLDIKNKQIPFLRRNIGFIFQDFKFLNDRNIQNNLKFVLEATGWVDNEKILKRIKQVLDEVEIADKILAMPYELSGGEQQRVSVARALLNSPKLILADEPTGNLDYETSMYITKKLIEQTNNGTSVIFVTHNEQLLKEFHDTEKWIVENNKLIN